MIFSTRKSAERDYVSVDDLRSELDRFYQETVRSDVLSLVEGIEAGLREELSSLEERVLSDNTSRQKGKKPVHLESDASESMVLADCWEAIREPQAPCLRRDPLPFAWGGSARSLKYNLETTGEAQLLLATSNGEDVGGDTQDEAPLTRSKRDPNLHRTYTERVLLDARPNYTADEAYEAYEAYTWFRCIRDFVQSSSFDVAVAVIIIMNCLLTGIQIDYMARYWTRDTPFAFRILNHIFCFIFTTEIFMRAMIYNQTFSSYVMRNKLDTTVLALMFIEEIFILFDIDSYLKQAGISNSLGVLRMARLIRLLRIVRSVEMLHIFGELRILIVSLTDSLSTLIWAFSLILLISFIFAVFITELVTMHKIQVPHHVMELEQELLTIFFGSVDVTMLTLYAVCLSGVEWTEVMDPLVKYCTPAAAFLFLLYTTLSIIAMMNVVTSIFVTAAMKVAHNDHKSIILAKVVSLFNDHRQHPDGHVTWDEFVDKLDHPIMTEFFGEFSIDVKLAHEAFDYLDMDLRGTVNVCELMEEINKRTQSPVRKSVARNMRQKGFTQAPTRQSVGGFFDE